MGKGAPGIPKAESSVGCGEKHATTGLIIRRVLKSTDEVCGHHAEGLDGPDVADRIRSLVGRAKDRSFRAGTPVEGEGRVRLDGMGENIESGACGNG
jgi:hypothetical protein